MRDVQDGGALRREIADEPEQALHVLGPEAARRLVEHEHAQLPSPRSRSREGAGDLDELTVGERQRIHTHMGVDAPATEGARQRRLHQTRRRRAVEHPEARGLDAERHVRGDVQVGAERELLVHHGEAAGARVGRACRHPRLAVQLDRARVGLHEPCERLQERALARPVLAHQRMHLAALRHEIDAAERLRPSERLAELPDDDARGTHRSVITRRRRDGQEGSGKRYDCGNGP